MKEGVRYFLDFFPPPRFLAMPAFGVALSDKSLRYAELIRKRGGYIVGHYGEKEIPAGVVISGKIEKPEVLKNLFEELRKEHDIAFIRLAFQEQQGYVFRLDMPFVKKSEVRNSLELQLEEHVPIPVASALFDYQYIPLKKGIAERHPLIEVGVSVLPRSIIDSYVHVLREAGLTPLSFEIEAHALARALLSPSDLDTYMIVDIGSTRAGLSIVSRGVTNLTWTIPVGGDMLTDAVSKAFGIDFKEARKKKEKEGLKHDKEIEHSNKNMARILSVQARLLREEIKKREIYWHTHVDENGKSRDRIRQILLCGGEANVPGLFEYLAGGLDVPLVLGNPWKNIASLDTYTPPIPYNDSLRYVTAFGLALRGTL